MEPRRLIPVLAAVAVATAVLGARPATALAQDATIDACVHHGSGVLYLPGDRGEGLAACAEGDEAVSWNEAGPPGILQVSVVEATSPSIAIPAGTHAYMPVTATCPAGWTVIGGGASPAVTGPGGVLTLQPGPILVISKPVEATGSWHAFYRLDNGDGLNAGTATISAHAICAELSS